MRFAFRAMAASIAAAIHAMTASAAAQPNPKMPAVLERIGRCETGMRWDWATRDYVTAFGLYRGTYESFRHLVSPLPPRDPGMATPAQQVAVALAVAHQVGYSAWGCYRHAWVRNG
jgi:hypothetical protein